MLNLNNLTGKEVSIIKNDIIFQKGDRSSSFYLVVEGAVQLIKDDLLKAEESRIIRENEYFGLDEFYRKVNRETTAVAAMDSVLMRISARNDADKKIDGRKTKLPVLDKKMLSQLSSIKAIDNLITQKSIGNIDVISIDLNRCNLLYAPRFKEFLFAQIEDGSKKIIIDMQRAKVIDSSFLGSLVASLRKINSMGGQIKLVCNKNVSSWIFHVTRMDKVFNIYNDLNSALNEFNREG